MTRRQKKPRPKSCPWREAYKEDELVGVDGGEEFVEEISGAGEMG